MIRQDSSDSRGAQLSPLAVDHGDAQTHAALLPCVQSILSPPHKRPRDSDTGATRFERAHYGFDSTVLDESKANAQHPLPEFAEQDGHPGTPQSSANSHDMSKQVVEQDNMYAQDNMPTHGGASQGAGRHFTYGQAGHSGAHYQYQQQHMYAPPCQPAPQPVPQSMQHNINYASQVNQMQTMQFAPAAPMMPGYYVHTQPQAFVHPAPSAPYYPQPQPVAMQTQVVHYPQSFVMAQPAQYQTINPTMQPMPARMQHMVHQYPTHTHMHMQAAPQMYQNQAQAQMYQNQAQAQSRPQQPMQQPTQPAPMADAEEKQALPPYDPFVKGDEDNRQCVLCDKGPFNSAIMELSHIQSKQHKLNKKIAATLPAHAQRILGSIRPAPAKYGRCDVCDIDYPTEAQSKSHPAGKLHKENVRLQERGLSPRKGKKKKAYATTYNRLAPNLRHDYERQARMLSPKVARKSEDHQ